MFLLFLQLPLDPRVLLGVPLLVSTGGVLTLGPGHSSRGASLLVSTGGVWLRVGRGRGRGSLVTALQSGQKRLASALPALINLHGWWVSQTEVF